MSGDEVAITDVDCTPRRIRCESEGEFEGRMRHLGARFSDFEHRMRRANRDAALHETIVDGARSYFTRCVCGWHGIQVVDPEVSRREYDAHACTVGVDEEHPALRKYDRWGGKRPESTLRPAFSDPLGESAVEVDHAIDEAAQRMALLELK